MLKAANIIVGHHDDKHFSCNPDVIKDFELDYVESEDDDDEHV